MPVPGLPAGLGAQPSPARALLGETVSLEDQGNASEVGDGPLYDAGPSRTRDVPGLGREPACGLRCHGRASR